MFLTVKITFIFTTISLLLVFVMPVTPKHYFPISLTTAKALILVEYYDLCLPLLLWVIISHCLNDGVIFFFVNWTIQLNHSQPWINLPILTACRVSQIIKNLTSLGCLLVFQPYVMKSSIWSGSCPCTIFPMKDSFLVS